MLCSKKDCLIFLAGAAAFNAVIHAIFAYAGTFPFHYMTMEWTQQMNMISIIVNAVVSVGLLWLAHKDHRGH